MKHFILMADVIQSGKLNSNVVKRQFAQIIQRVNTEYSKNIKSPLTITLGDEFQGVIKTITAAVSLIIFLEESILKSGSRIKLRYVLHEGEIDTPINKKIAYGMLGKGLTDARETLISMKKEKHRFKFVIDNTHMGEVYNNLFGIYMYFIDKWKIEDYPIVIKFLELGNYKEVAISLKKNASLMWKREKSLNIEQYNLLKNTITLLTSKQ